VVKRLLVDTGLYELIFRPRISKEMAAWIREFNPDIIFAQGYCLTFTWLPVMLKKRLKKKLTFFTTDDWPSYLYSGQHGEIKLFIPLMRRIVKSATAKLMSAVDVPFAFGQPMSDEYTVRYKRKFITLSHSDNAKRFADAVSVRSHEDGIYTILAVGGFTKYRWPLMLDVNESCRLLNEEGIKVRAAVLCSAIDQEGKEELKKAQYIDLFDDPGNDLLPAYLKGADLLLLAESFDEGRVSAIGLSISSKSHLFMFSRKPIIVYAHPSTGVCKYAEKYKWARLVTERNIETLRKTIRDLLVNDGETKRLISYADEVAIKFHLNEVNQNRFLESLTNNPD
jgi:glycosyltransferase involved in cell wall biosynthesis